MQNRHFDIAGPNPTPEEQKKIDEQYIVYLDQERRSTIAAAFTAKQQQLLQQASLKAGPEKKTPVPRASPVKQQAAAGDLRSRIKATNCAKDSFSCEWPRLSESIKDIKKLFSSSPNKAKRS
jgi:CRISPR/Cas system-associated endonuclease Cas1